ncbi:hypothetical protein L3V79_08240 [Thiotrichales bacterium 19S9-12]|nr:hypothetical protein [Thiotrichales bacterium 19S9-11]MCF6812342.1 hypothetical protein [Thiotrichales bacterium 19S9-12]
MKKLQLTELIKSKPNTLKEWLGILEQIGFSGRLDPSDIRSVLDILEIKKDFYLITVTGTNGKGSTSHLLEHILLSSGYKVGLFSSPHLFKFNERVRINGKNIPSQLIVDAFDIVYKTLIEQGLNGGYFVYAFLAACLCFSQQKLDFVILEVGCGGRLDPSNAFDADMLAITSIGLDHQEMLGDTREKIAYEKSALVRRNIPVIIGEHDFPKNASDLLVQHDANVFQIGKQFDLTNINRYQQAPAFLHRSNLSMVLQMLDILKVDYTKISDSVIHTALLSFVLPGRLQVLKVKGKTILFDVGHNAQSSNHLIQWLSTYYPQSNYYAFYSALSSKDVEKIIQITKNTFQYWYLADLSSIDSRAMSLNALSNFFQYEHFSGHIDAIELFDHALEELKSSDVLVVFGSFVLVAHILKFCSIQGYLS